jgi:thiol-disulfide isomerase/thioredoxin
LLIKDVAGEFSGRVKVVTEEYGNSEMAKRFGVRRYPVVFVDDVLVARPKDFGFAGPEDSGGRYVPWREPANQERFKRDLRTMVARRLQGERIEGVAPDEDVADLDGPATLPPGPFARLSGAPLDFDRLRGRIVIVEMWATWCPPCRSTLAWLNALQKRRKGDVEVVAIAVDSKEADVRRMVSEMKLSFSIVMGSAAVIKQFGEVASVPKLMIFDRAHRRSDVIYGAPPDLHERLERLVGEAAAKSGS